MKNKMDLAGVLGFVLVFGLFLIGCPMDGDSTGEGQVTKFEGTWKKLTLMHHGYIFLKIIMFK
jgi:hypothetical protein